MADKTQQIRSIVKYKNRLNSIPLRQFNPTEMDLFFSIAAQVRDRGSETITLSFKQLQKLSTYHRSTERLVADLESTYDKLLQLNAKIDDGDTITRFTLFNMYSISRSKQTVSIAVNSRFKSLFNDLDQWTVFGLEQFVGLKSTYSKTMYRLVKQFRTTGFRRFGMDEFRYLLAIPESYKSYHIMSRVVDVINSELPALIPGFKLTPIRQSEIDYPGKPVPKRGRGAAIVAFKAVWTKETVSQRKEITPKEERQKRGKITEKLPEWARKDYKPDIKPASPQQMAETKRLLAELRAKRTKK